MERLTEKAQLQKYTRKLNVTVNEVEVKLAEYEDLEEQGLLLRLPCPIGTTVYLIDINDYFVLNEFIEEVPFKLDMLDYVGKYVFLTKEEAEAELQKLKEE